MSRIGEDEAVTDQFPQSAPMTQAGEGRRWRYELDWGSSEQDIPMLVQKVQLPVTTLLLSDSRSTY